MHFLSRIHISNVREYAKMEAYLVLKSKENIHVSGIQVIQGEQVSWKIEKNGLAVYNSSHDGVFQVQLWDYNATALICSAKFTKTQYSLLGVEARDESKNITIRLEFQQQSTRLLMSMSAKRGKETKRTDSTNRQSNNSIKIPQQNSSILKSSASLLSCLSERQLYRVREKNTDYVRNKEVSPTYYRYKRQQKN